MKTESTFTDSHTDRFINPKSIPPIMAKIYDVPADQLVLKLAEALKSEDIPAPEWTPFVKTGVHANKPPQKSDWWYTRCASLLRKIYVHGPLGINELCSMYGGGKPHGYGMAHHKDASGAIIRNAVQGLEKLGYLSKVAKKGRVISDKGMKKLDGMATEILQELVAKDKRLKIYT